MEISQYLDFDFLIRFLEGLQKFLGENSEILIHDYRKGYDHTIVYALNPAVSGRAVGGSPKGGMITQLGKDIEPMKDSIQTFSNGPKDRFYKSFTTLIPDENGKIVGSVCVNLDVSDLLNAQRALGAFVQYPMTHHAPTNDIDALATKNVDDILKYYMRQSLSVPGTNRCPEKRSEQGGKDPRIGLPRPEGCLQNFQDQRSSLRDASGIKIYALQLP